MAEGDDGADKSLEASEYRIQQARKDGNVPQSPELLTFARYSGMLVALMGLTGSVAFFFGESMSAFLSFPHAITTVMFTGGTVNQFFSPAFLAFLAVVGLSAVLTVVALIVQKSITFAPKKIKPDLSRLSPMKNAGKKFGPAGLIDFGKSTVKVTVVTVVGIMIGLSNVPDLVSSVGAPPAMLAGELLRLLTQMVLAAALLSAVAAAIDVPLKWQQHRKELRMSVQELRDEQKENDGDPKQKSQRMAQARAIAQNRQLQDVPTADVVVVNPEHYAVALRWDRDGGEVPRCVAKGIDHMALRIRERADEAGVPIYRDVPTARSLYASIDVGQEINREHFEAVAAAIRFADKLRK